SGIRVAGSTRVRLSPCIESLPDKGDQTASLVEQMTTAV
ncbi:hypothetical protein A2U01_0110511, partial [Trifolium medium]|nr:hypothetical protein [Trifolium medium]